MSWRARTEASTDFELVGVELKAWCEKPLTDEPRQIANQTRRPR